MMSNNPKDTHKHKQSSDDWKGSRNVKWNASQILPLREIFQEYNSHRFNLLIFISFATSSLSHLITDLYREAKSLLSFSPTATVQCKKKHMWMSRRGNKYVEYLFFLLLYLLEKPAEAVAIFFSGQQQHFWNNIQYDFLPILSLCLTLFPHIFIILFFEKWRFLYLLGGTRERQRREKTYRSP